MRPGASVHRIVPDGTGPWAALLAGAVLLLGAGPLAPDAAAQSARGHFRGARLPPAGEVWLELAPAFESWNSQYILDGPADSLRDGTEEPLSADVDGPIAERLYPGTAPLFAGLRGDAAALGYDSLPADEFSLGGLAFDRLHANRRLVPVTLELGLHERVAGRVTAPLVKSQTEAFFSFQPGGASFAPLPSVVTDPRTFVSEWSSARASLRDQLDGGSLSEGERARARELLESSGAFLEAFSRRAEAGLLFPLAGSRPGSAVLSRVDSLARGFQDFGIGVPGLDLAASATTASLQSFFTGGSMEADSLRGRDRGWAVEGLEVGVRLGLLDTFDPPPDTAGGGLELRTTIGAAVRLPSGPAANSPFVTPASFLDVPISAAQTDLEVSLYQDVRLGPLLVQGRGRYGWQLSDEVELRVHPPDRPFALPGASAAVERDLGDYLEIHLSPRLVLNRALSLGAEYSFWRKGSDRYALASAPGPGGPREASPLAVESSERRHRLGVGIHYRAAGDSPSPGARPVELSFLFQAPVAGSGGQTPVSDLTSVRIRIPVGLPSPDFPLP